MEGNTESIHLANVAHRAQAATAARDELGAALVAARRDGVALRKLAAASGISHEHVRKLTDDHGREANGA